MADDDSDNEQQKAPEILPKHKIRFNDMSMSLVKEVIKKVDELFQKYDLEKDVALNLISWIKTQPQFKIGEGSWQCIIGYNFGCSLNFDSSVLTFFDILTTAERKSVLLFKSC